MSDSHWPEQLALFVRPNEAGLAQQLAAPRSLVGQLTPGTDFRSQTADLLILVLTSQDEVVLDMCLATATSQQMQPAAAVTSDRPWSYAVKVMCNTTNDHYRRRLTEKFRHHGVIECVHSVSNGRPGAGHNACIQYFASVRHRFRYMLMVDGDDFLYPTALAVVQKSVQLHPELDVMMVQGNDGIRRCDDLELSERRLYIMNNLFMDSWIETCNANLFAENPTKFVNPFQGPLSRPGSGTPGRAMLWSAAMFDRIGYRLSDGTFAVPTPAPSPAMAPAGDAATMALGAGTAPGAGTAATQPRVAEVALRRRFYSEQCAVHDDQYAFMVLWLLDELGIIRLFCTSNMHIMMYNGFNTMSVTRENEQTDDRYMLDTSVVHSWLSSGSSPDHWLPLSPAILQWQLGACGRMIHTPLTHGDELGAQLGAHAPGASQQPPSLLYAVHKYRRRPAGWLAAHNERVLHGKLTYAMGILNVLFRGYQDRFRNRNRSMMLAMYRLPLTQEFIRRRDANYVRDAGMDETRYRSLSTDDQTLVDNTEYARAVEFMRRYMSRQDVHYLVQQALTIDTLNDLELDRKPSAMLHKLGIDSHLAQFFRNHAPASLLTTATATLQTGQANVARKDACEQIEQISN